MESEEPHAGETVAPVQDPVQQSPQPSPATTEVIDDAPLVIDTQTNSVLKSEPGTLLKKDPGYGLPPHSFHIVPYPPDLPSIAAERINGSQVEKAFLTLPSRYAVPCGLAQVFVGGSMVVCGAVALRYQNYFSYYGSGLWAGTLASISGIVNLMATRKRLKQPDWLFGGYRRRIGIFIAAILTSLLASSVAAILSISGLIEDAQYEYIKDLSYYSYDDDVYDYRKSSGVLINALILLFSLLQIILTFASLGIALRVYFASRYGTLVHSGSDRSEITEVVGNEFEAKTDRVLCWLGQRSHFSRTGPASMKPPRAATFRDIAVTAGPRRIRAARSVSTRMAPSIVQTAPTPMLVVLPPPHCKPVMPQPPAMPFIIPGGPMAATLPRGFAPFPVPQYVFPQPLMVPIATLPRAPRGTSLKSVPSKPSKGYRTHYRRENNLQRDMNDDQTNKSVSSVTSDPIRDGEITEEEVGRTYTGLDRAVAEEFISSTMARH